MELKFQELSHDGRYFYWSHDRLFCREHFVRIRLREALTMVENIIVGIVAFGLIIYLFWTLIRPENF